LPGAGPPGARAHRGLRGRRRLRVHRLQRERHRHRPAHRGAGAASRLHLPDGLPLGLPPGDSRLPQPGRPPLRGGPRERPPDPQAGEPRHRGRAPLAPGLPRLRLRSPRLRPARDPRPDQGRPGRGRRRLDALEPAQRLHGGRAPPQGSRRRPVIARRAAGVVCVLLALAPAAAAAPPLPPNELGRVMILEYHKIDRPEERWTRTPENFRRDLETLYARGYRLLALNDLLDGRIALPAGTTPVVLTFDDSSPGQFRYLERNGTLEIDPQSGVGILEAFIKDHPDFGRAATFYVLPGASRPNRLWDQPEHAGRKLQWLVARGYEIGNHTLWHANLGQYGEATVRGQVARAQEWIQRHVPAYRPRTLALPHGVYPKDVRWVLSGTVDGITYRHDAVLMV